ncbi:hypothetical protein LPJ78_005027 [Coemansia sp. RSA 989]|nr:Mob1/phocein [Coemansia mojavensis]KAJ1739425.1 hypothetical protein LPJ68_004696 [Coemansia sp. RSA 1086]KAJ1750668.1 hypothetical protein LPJ79_002701 [Coemansia sp. RSA 1821]KAJ1861944.1 hypothetical protein LPJ78_005027 [Coemansia sp. RSA 989]KAJ1872539.1 hypothetical protein LPJ55_002997 [Coemansia sp. RSA 990]KAJ2648885.1 hypothetical protein IWW40_003543 [Coemansia sp. RSA 1250]KAJ2669453.1 hypothetical protein IWW42_004577 [Coemansia sp. RSA 1085]
MSETRLRMNLPGMREEECFWWNTESLELEEPAGVSQSDWILEHMRQILIDMGYYLTQLHGECTSQTCPVMRAQETTYYCAGSHGHPRPCSAISYSVHTLDFAVCQLPKRHFQSMARRLYRVFAHAYYHHREFFERQEAVGLLYSRFVRLARKYELVAESLVIIPDLPTTVEA